MLIVIPFCHKDAKAAVKLLEWIYELDGQSNRHRCLAVGANGISDDLAFAVEQAARKAYTTAKMVRTLVHDERGWPQSCNTLFTCAATYIHETLKCPFWWNEADCVPLKSGWLDALEDEYVSYKKPFMGSIVKEPLLHLTGCAIYPHDIAFYNHKALGTQNPIAWDCIAPELTLPHTHHTNLFHHCWNNPKTNKVATFPTVESMSMIRAEAVVFHRNKDLTLVDRLREKRNTPDVSIQNKPVHDTANMLTVVITSYQRPQHLRLAFDSCIEAGVSNIVVAATGKLDKMRPVFDELRRIKSDVVILDDSGLTSNQSWLHGVSESKTKYVSLLHDDDLILPDYIDLVTPGIESDSSFVMVQARNHGVPDYIEKDSDNHGQTPSSVLRPRLEKKGNLAISPLRGVFRRDDLAQWLKECDGMPKSCYLRPGFLVGNDLYIWLSATEKYSHFFNIAAPAVSFGHWDGSTTVDSLGKGDKKLFKIYDETRRWHLTKKKMPIHIFTMVLDGMPFIKRHLDVFKKLKIPWEWHIVEGAASNTHCTKWCKPQAGRLSQDGTTEYLDQIASENPRVHVYRKELWDGKIEMVNSPLDHIKEECVLLEVDCDEYWTAEQLESMVELFKSDPTKSHAMFWCRYFFGPHLVMEDRNCYGNSPTQDWKRAWRFKPGDRFLRHEPPILSRESTGFTHDATEAAGLVFDHHGYVQRSQVEFKERFYGYKDAVKHWERLQEVRSGKVKLSDYLPWVNPGNSGMVKAIQ